VDCYARDTLKQGDWIIDDGETTLVSSTFELGFFTSNNKRFVGIWYKQDQQIVVWVANLDSPVVPLELLELQKMATLRYGIILLDTFIGILVLRFLRLQIEL